MALSHSSGGVPSSVNSPGANAGSPLQNLILSGSTMYVRQRTRLIEILTNWDTANRYELTDDQGQQVGQMTERGGGFWRVIARLFLRSHRGFTIDVADDLGFRTLQFSRRFFWIFSDIVVSTPQGIKLGSAHRRFSIFWKKYDLCDPAGEIFARIDTGIWRLWTFQILDDSGNVAGIITKRWGGALKELFTNADTFQIQFGTRPWKAHERAIILAVAISIEFDYFERKGSSGGILNILGG